MGGTCAPYRDTFQTATGTKSEDIEMSGIIGQNVDENRLVR